ncbi:MFS transporter [Burkholderia gladioli]|uniref:MFS transporter n=1 Tax=Burkholderia gladioli TaxID=28095 RepID=UPI001FC857D8|nr:MFS transporter [Burkholderia gladioli]
MVVLLCALLMFLDGFDTQAISYIVPALSHDWHLPREILGSIFSAALVGLMVGYLAVAPLSSRFGHKRMMIASTLMFAAFTMLTVFATSVSELIGLRFLTGIGLGAAAPSAVALTCEFAPKRLRSTFVLLVYCGFSLGFVVAGLAAGVLMPVFGWQSMMEVGAVAPLVLSVLSPGCCPNRRCSCSAAPMRTRGCARCSCGCFRAWRCPPTRASASRRRRNRGRASRRWCAAGPRSAPCCSG